jgi:hypothetical protein
MNIILEIISNLTFKVGTFGKFFSFDRVILELSVFFNLVTLQHVSPWATFLASREIGVGHGQRVLV